MQRWTGKDVSAEFAERIARAFARHAKNVSVGWDCRLSSPTLAASVVRGLRSAGANALRLGLCPAPFVAFSVHHHPILDGGIMITGAGEPADHNGFELYLRKERLSGERLAALVAEADETPAPLSLGLGLGLQGQVADLDVLPLYRRHVYGKCLKVGAGTRRKLLLDLGNGSASTVFPQVLHPRFDVVGVNCTLDGRFPNRHPAALAETDLAQLIEKVRAEEASFGIALDGDSNRIAVVDARGRVLPDPEIASGLSGEVQLAGPGRFLFGGAHGGYDDGVYSVLRFCEAASRENSRLIH
jgi:phosphomannomutase